MLFDLDSAVIHTSLPTLLTTLAVGLLDRFDPKNCCALHCLLGTLSCKISVLHAYWFFGIFPTITPIFGITLTTVIKTTERNCCMVKTLNLPYPIIWYGWWYDIYARYIPDMPIMSVPCASKYDFFETNINISDKSYSLKVPDNWGQDLIADFQVCKTTCYALSSAFVGRLLFETSG